MKAIVSEDKCVGCGLCPEVCPEIFKMEDGKAVAYVEIVPSENASACMDAAAQCPVDAIEVSR